MISNGDKARTLTSLALKTEPLASFDVAGDGVGSFFFVVFSLFEGFGEDMLSDCQIFFYEI